MLWMNDTAKMRVGGWMSDAACFHDCELNAVA
jgi:hypothetical protein